MNRPPRCRAFPADGRRLLIAGNFPAFHMEHSEGSRRRPPLLLPEPRKALGRKSGRKALPPASSPPGVEALSGRESRLQTKAAPQRSQSRIPPLRLQGSAPGRFPWPRGCPLSAKPAVPPAPDSGHTRKRPPAPVFRGTGPEEIPDSPP